MQNNTDFSQGNRRGQGKGKMGGAFAAGPGGNCVCPSCHKQVAHVRGEPCNQHRCPECGSIMIRA